MFCCGNTVFNQLKKVSRSFTIRSNIMESKSTKDDTRKAKKEKKSTPSGAGSDERNKRSPRNRFGMKKRKKSKQGKTDTAKEAEQTQNADDKARHEERRKSGKYQPPRGTSHGRVNDQVRRRTESENTGESGEADRTQQGGRVGPSENTGSGKRLSSRKTDQGQQKDNASKRKKPEEMNKTEDADRVQLNDRAYQGWTNLKEVRRSPRNTDPVQQKDQGELQTHIDKRTHPEKHGSLGKTDKKQRTDQEQRIKGAKTSDGVDQPKQTKHPEYEVGKGAKGTRKPDKADTPKQTIQAKDKARRCDVHPEKQQSPRDTGQTRQKDEVRCGDAYTERRQSSRDTGQTQQIDKAHIDKQTHLGKQRFPGKTDRKQHTDQEQRMKGANKSDGVDKPKQTKHPEYEVGKGAKGTSKPDKADTPTQTIQHKDKVVKGTKGTSKPDKADTAKQTKQHKYKVGKGAKGTSKPDKADTPKQTIQHKDKGTKGTSKPDKADKAKQTKQLKDKDEHERKTKNKKKRLSFLGHSGKLSLSGDTAKSHGKAEARSSCGADIAEGGATKQGGGSMHTMVLPPRNHYKFIDDDDFEDLAPHREELEYFDNKGRESCTRKFRRYTLVDNLNISTVKIDEQINEIRVAVIGKTGHGKSSTANSLMGNGNDMFVTGHKNISETDASCVGTCELNDNRKLIVMDSPGLKHTGRAERDVISEMERVVELLPGGIHAFLYVWNATDHRVSQEDMSVLKTIKDNFGKSFMKHCITVYSNAEGKLRGDMTLDNFVSTQDEHLELKEFLDEMDWKIVAVNNTSTIPAERKRNRDVLLTMIYRVIDENKMLSYTYQKPELAGKL